MMGESPKQYYLSPQISPLSVNAVLIFYGVCYLHSPNAP